MSGVRILTVIVVTPEATVRESHAQFVVVPLYDGELGVAPGHSAMIGRLGYGEMRIVEGNRTDRYYVDGGFVQVSGNVVSILTNRAVPAEQVNGEAAAEQLTPPATDRRTRQSYWRSASGSSCKPGPRFASPPAPASRPALTPAAVTKPLPARPLTTGVTSLNPFCHGDVRNGLIA